MVVESLVTLSAIRFTLLMKLLFCKWEVMRVVKNSPLLSILMINEFISASYSQATAQRHNRMLPFTSMEIKKPNSINTLELYKGALYFAWALEYVTKDLFRLISRKNLVIHFKVI